MLPARRLRLEPPDVRRRAAPELAAGHSVGVTTELDVAIQRFQTCIEERDHTTAETVLDADYALVIVQPSRVIMPRSRWLELLSDYIVHSYRVLDSVADVSDELAVVLHRDEMSATVLGEDRSGTFVVTDVWRRRDLEWKIWRRHSTPLTAGHIPAT